jgi:hypothetical protein
MGPARKPMGKGQGSDASQLHRRGAPVSSSPGAHLCVMGIALDGEGSAMCALSPLSAAGTTPRQAARSRARSCATSRCALPPSNAMSHFPLQSELEADTLLTILGNYLDN